MSEISRRRFIKHAGAFGVTAPLGSLPRSVSPSGLGPGSTMGSLEGAWYFRLDPDRRGEPQGWHAPQISMDGWDSVEVPHTWQICAETAGYLGVAWYRKSFEAPASWEGQAVRLEFEAVYHSATVWLNGRRVGEHLRKGYTAFVCDLSSVIQPGRQNTLAVRVDNSFDQAMLPRGDSFDWTVDGGITRPVSVLVTPPAFIERVDVEAIPDPAGSTARVDLRCTLRNTAAEARPSVLGYRVIDESTGHAVTQSLEAERVVLKPRDTTEVVLQPISISRPRLWHFDHPHLYRLEVHLSKGGTAAHSFETCFGVRRIEVRDGGFYLNGERMWLMGVERMAGSHPDYGMAEPDSLIRHDHDDIKELNCVFTRMHWQQDRRILDYCDRKGILVQVEIPAWGPDTFKGMGSNPSAEIMQNGLEQLREMIRRDRNHPCIFAWGLCNEIGGQNPPAYEFTRRLYEEAGKLDPGRLRTYASNSLQKTPEKDVAGMMDFIEWNEYYESWYGGTADSLRRNLEEIHRAFPGKMVVISEYGYCECAADRKGGDPRRSEILKNHNTVFREFDWLGGAIFFCYNDYRTHIGDKGVGALKQRVHGVVDLYGGRKPSFEVLRRESSPVESLDLTMEGNRLTATVKTRSRLPAYRLSGYRLRWIAYGFEDLPMEQRDTALPVLAPGEQAKVILELTEKNPKRVRADIIRPTGFSALTAEYIFQ